MHASGTKQIMPKHSLETSATISKLKYFGHTMHKSHSMKKDLILGLTCGSGKLRKTVYKTISRNMRNCEDELVQHLNCEDELVQHLNCEDELVQHLNCEDELVQHLNCHVKQSAMEGRHF
jgi:hypothetical protein